MSQEQPVPDPIFANPRLAEIYDDLDGPRTDLDTYMALVQEFGARSVLDIGCGTGSLACMLALRGCEVIAVDPAEASIGIARQKVGADRVRWFRGYATDLPELEVDLGVMTGNVAQVFLADEDWLLTLRALARVLRPSGRLVFEVRDPARKAWRSWTRDQTYSRVDVDGVGRVESFVELLEASGQLVSFRWTYRFEKTGNVLTSDSTLRFREKEEIEASLAKAGFAVLEVRDAPDRPDAELLFVSELAG